MIYALLFTILKAKFVNRVKAGKTAACKKLQKLTIFA